MSTDNLNALVGAGSPSSSMPLLAAWSDLETELEAHRSDLNLSFGMEYSSVVDWVADLTPRRGHPKARQYGEVWRGQGNTPAEAISRAIRAMRDELTDSSAVRINEAAQAGKEAE